MNSKDKQGDNLKAARRCEVGNSISRDFVKGFLATIAGMSKDSTLNVKIGKESTCYYNSL